MHQEEGESRDEDSLSLSRGHGNGKRIRTGKVHFGLFRVYCYLPLLLFRRIWVE